MFNKMDGYQFEDYIVKIFKMAGFKVEPTQYSNDGGIDLVSYCERPFFVGKYIIQCKNWTNPVGVREIRELYGVTIDENACKGILITTSCFTEQALDFAQNKNLELIDGKMLNKIVKQYTDCENTEEHDTSQTNNVIINYSDYEKFDNKKYQYFSNLLENDIKHNMPHKNKYGVLWQYVINNDFEIINAGLIPEMHLVLDAWQKYVFNKKSDTYKKMGLQLYRTHLYLLEGKIDKMLEEILAIGLKRFTNNFDEPFGICFTTVELINFLSVCKLIDSPLTEQFIYAKLEEASSSFFRKIDYQETMKKYIGKIYIPIVSTEDSSLLDREFMPMDNLCDIDNLISVCWNKSNTQIRDELEFVVKMNS